MKLLIAFGTFVFAILFAGVLTYLASTAYPPVNGQPQNQVLIPVALITFLLGWLLAFALARRYSP